MTRGTSDGAEVTKQRPLDNIKTVYDDKGWRQPQRDDKAKVANDGVKVKVNLVL